VSQSLAKVYVHAIFSTRNREPLLAAEWRDDIFSVLGGAANHFQCQSLIVGGVADHVHLLFQLGRTIALAEAINRIKSASSRWIGRMHPEIGQFHWQAGYGAFSVSQSNVEAVRAYVQDQPEHHKKLSFQDELRQWLRRYEIEWDERYVWD
jgi:REP element-mobilizing transposase RayT